MPPERPRRLAADASRLLPILLVVGLLAAVVFYLLLPPADRPLLVVAAAVSLLAGAAALLMLRLHLRAQRALAWRRALRQWSQNVKAGGTPTFTSPAQLLPRELERFAAQVYSRLGHTVQPIGRPGHGGDFGGDKGVDFKLVNPQGQLELVQCEQWDRPVAETDVRELYAALTREHAVHASLWAPAGFTPAALNWAKGKPLLLADARAIARLIETAYAG